MGGTNQVGPVIALTLGIFLAYLVLTGRTAGLVALIGGNGSATGTTGGSSNLSTSQSEAANTTSLGSTGGSYGTAASILVPGSQYQGIAISGQDQ